MVRKYLINTQSKLTILENDKQELQTTLANLKGSVEWANRQSETTIKATLELVEEKIHSMKRRFGYVEETLEEALLFSNKTHYMEEVNILRREKKLL